jgi:3-dehydrosphinganine reductase
MFECSYCWAAAVCAVGVGLLQYLTHRVPRLDFNGKHILVTGGSAGIGLAIAKEAARRGAHVTLAARRMETLKEAQKDVAAVAKPSRVVSVVSIDVSDQVAVESALRKVDSERPVDIAVLNAGLSYPARFMDIPPTAVQNMMNTNVVGVFNVARAVLPGMQARKAGRLVVVSSMASVAAVAGFTVYSATKAAIRAFAQALDMEVAHEGIRVQVLNPPDVDTPGFQTENTHKSPECKAICEGSGVCWQADDVARRTLNGMEEYSFQINIGLDGWMLGTLSANMEPPTGVFQLLLQCLLTGTLRFVGVFYTKAHYGIVQKIRKQQK